MLTLFLLGTIGSLLPDIDADNSVPLRICFTLTSILFAFLVMFSLVNWFPSVAELLVIWIAAYVIFRCIIFFLFTRLTTHRGIFHSLPAALFFGFLTATTSELMWYTPPHLAWLQALFVTTGYILHLVLDEIYSLNLFGIGAKRSLGSACKLWYRKSLPATLYMYLATIILYLLTPSTLPLQDMIQNNKITTALEQALMPKTGWFELQDPNSGLARISHRMHTEDTNPPAVTGLLAPAD